MFLSKSKILLVGVLLFCGTISAGWWQTYGGATLDVGRCVLESSDGNYVITGRTGNDFWIFKTDTFGTILWSKTYTGGGAITNYWVEEVADKGYVVSWNPGLLKTDSQGDTLWTKNYGISSYCVDETSDEGYILTGHHGYGDGIVLLRTNIEGDSLWSKSYMEAGWDLAFGYFVRQTNDGGYIVTGEVADSFLETRALLLLKTNAQGDVQWTQLYGENSSARGYCVRQTFDEGYIVTGGIGSRLWLLKTDSLGDTIWSFYYGSEGTGHCVEQTSDSGYIVVGSTASWTALLTNGFMSNGDLWLIKTDKNGDTLWTRTYGGDNSDIGRCVQQTSDRGYIIVGETWSYGAGERDLYLLRTDSLGLLVITEDPINESEKTWQLVSSVGSQMRLRYSNAPQGFHACIYDVLGRKISEINTSCASGIITWGTGYPAGVYFIRADEKTQQTERFVIVH
jgi:hypothetical protein